MKNVRKQVEYIINLNTYGGDLLRFVLKFSMNWDNTGVNLEQIIPIDYTVGFGFEEFKSIEGSGLQRYFTETGEHTTLGSITSLKNKDVIGNLLNFRSVVDFTLLVQEGVTFSDIREFLDVDTSTTLLTEIKGVDGVLVIVNDIDTDTGEPIQVEVINTLVVPTTTTTTTEPPTTTTTSTTSI